MLSRLRVNTALITLAKAPMMTSSRDLRLHSSSTEDDRREDVPELVATAAFRSSLAGMAPSSVGSEVGPTGSGFSEEGWTSLPESMLLQILRNGEVTGDKVCGVEVSWNPLHGVQDVGLLLKLLEDADYFCQAMLKKWIKADAVSFQ